MDWEMHCQRYSSTERVRSEERDERANDAMCALCSSEPAGKNERGGECASLLLGEERGEV